MATTTTASSLSGHPSKPPKLYSCARCFERKVKCDKQQPCSACAKSGHQNTCVFRVPAKPRRRKKRTQEEILLARLKHYEELLKSNGISPATATGSPDDDPTVEEGEAESEALQNLDSADSPGSRKGSTLKDPEDGGKGRLFVGGGKSMFLENQLFSTLNEELADTNEILPDSDEEMHIGIKLSDPFRTDLVLGFTPTIPPTKTLHPSPEWIFKLWSIYLENINPLTKIVHQPTVQTALLEAAFNLDNVDRHFEVLMFGIYSSAIASLSESQCEQMFNEDKMTLLARFLHGSRQTLMMSRFMGTAEITVLQGFLLYIFATRQYYRPRTVWIMAGIASRIAQGMGLHRDGSTLGLPIFEAEMRRRLWWQIGILDSRSAELTGSSKGSEMWLWPVNVPMNINDIEMFPGMTESPTEHTKPTEMIGCLLRYEIGELRKRMPTQANSSFFTPNFNLSLEQGDQLVEDLEKFVEEKYLRYLDHNVPLHAHASLVGKVAVNTMRMMIHHPRRYSAEGKDLSKLPPTEREILWTSAVKILECDNLCYSNEALQRFAWHTRTYFQWHALLFVLADLRMRTEGVECERAWFQIDQMYKNHPEFLNGRVKRPLYFAVGNLCLKAWNAREHAMAIKDNPILDTPEYIFKLRDARARSKMTRDLVTGVAQIDMNGGLPGSGAPAILPRQTSLDTTAVKHVASDASTAMDPTLVDTLMEDLGPVDWAQWDILLQDFEVPET